MPSYNVVNYIGECIESVIKQSFREIEILMIDAGSTDGTANVIRKFAEEDDRIRVVTSDKKSYGYQLNLGIEMAQGDYIAIVETDDTIEPDMMDQLYQVARQFDLDYVKGGIALFTSFENEAVWKKMVPYIGRKEDGIIAPNKHPELYLTDTYLWHGLYKKSFLVQNKIILHETPGAAYQDVGFLFQVIGLAERAMYIKHPVYNYRQNNVGSSIFNSNGFHYLIEEYPFVMQQYVNRNIYDRNFLSYYYIRMFYQVTARYRTMAAYGKIWDGTENERKKIWEDIKAAYKNGYFEEAVLGKVLWFELMQYICDEELYWQYQASVYNTKRKYLQGLLANIRNSNEVVFFSKSFLGGFLHSLIKIAKIKTKICYCDNDIAKHGSNYMGTEVLSVIDAVKKMPDALYIIANNRYSTEMKQQLLKLGISREQIHVCMLEVDILLFQMAAYIE